MVQAAEEEPWTEYQVRTLPRGYTHPLRLGDLRSALVAQQLKVGTLLRSGVYPPSWRGRLGAVVLHVHRFGDSEAREWPPHASWEQLCLTVNGCPAALSKTIRAALLATGLPMATTWLAEAERRGNAWGASSHRMELLWRDGALHRSDDSVHGSLSFTESRVGGTPWDM